MAVVDGMVQRTVAGWRSVAEKIRDRTEAAVFIRQARRSTAGRHFLLSPTWTGSRWYERRWR